MIRLGFEKKGNMTITVINVKNTVAINMIAKKILFQLIMLENNIQFQQIGM